MFKLKTSLLAIVALSAGTVVTDVVAQTCKAPQPTICTRSCWGARAPGSISQMGALTRAIIHHTAGSGDYTTDYETGKARVRGVQNYHMDVNGWSDIAYHFLVNAGGHIYEGRSGSMSSHPRGAHDGCNADSFGFNVMGYYHPPYNQAFTSASRSSLEAVMAWRMPTGWSATGSGTYCGVSVGTLDGHYKVKATACPGDGIIPSIPGIRTGVASKRSCGVSKTARDVDNASATFAGTWATGSSAADKYGADYRYHSTAAVSEPATFSTALNVGAAWNVKAWWPAGSNRSATTPYVVAHDAGTTTVSKNQQVSGGSWQLLGTWNMTGTKTVQVSCWTATGFIVVADAIRWD